MRAEFEKQSAKSPIAGAANKVASGAGGGGGGGGAPSFDLAGWMAGTSPGPMSSLESAAEPVAAKGAKSGSTGRDTSGGSSRRRG